MKKDSNLEITSYEPLELFTSLISRYSNSNTQITESTENLRHYYSGSGRYYHNLSHLSHMLCEYKDIKDKVNNKAAFLFALFYHDIIYDVKKNDNEAKSALFMESVLKNTLFSDIELCKSLILATQDHRTSSNEDINLFLDTDMSILGKNTQTYTEYAEQVRKEFSIFPNFLYNKGRIKVLKI